MSDITHVEPVLSPAEDGSEPIRRGLKRQQRYIPPTEIPDEGRYAPGPHYAPCVSRTGYRRRHHDYDRDGRCIFCSKRRPWDPL